MTELNEQRRYGIILTRANLTEAEIKGAWWIEPDLTGANLTKAKIWGFQWEDFV